MSFLKTLQLMDLLTMQPLIRCVFEVVNLYSYFICSGFWCQRTTGQDSRSKEYIYWYTILDGPWSYSLWWESRCHLWLQGMANVLLQFLKYNYGQNLSLFCFWGVSTPLSFYWRLSACWGNSPYLFVLWLLSKVKLEDYSKFWVDTRTVIEREFSIEDTGCGNTSQDSLTLGGFFSPFLFWFWDWKWNKIFQMRPRLL